MYGRIVQKDTNMCASDKSYINKYKYVRIIFYVRTNHNKSYINKHIETHNTHTIMREPRKANGPKKSFGGLSGWRNKKK
jgi:hypothetical protein